MLTRPGRSRRRTIGITVLVAVGVVISLVTVWAYQVLGHPRLDHPTAADAVVVLGPVTEDGSLQTGLSLVDRGLAPRLLISVVPGQRGRVGHLCRGDSPGPATATLTCFVPNPTTTRGEARTVADLATRNNWHTVIVVTPTFHIERSRMTFRRCFPGTLEMVTPQTPPLKREWMFQGIYQSAAYLKAWTQDGC